MTHAQTKQHAHELVERLAPSQLSAMVGLLDSMLDPVAFSIANAPIDDEPETEDERQAVAASRAWLAAHPGEGIPLEDMLAELDLTSQGSASRLRSA